MEDHRSVKCGKREGVLLLILLSLGMSGINGLSTENAMTEERAESESAPVERVFSLEDGTELEGTIKSFTDDDAIIVIHENGVRRIELTSVQEPQRGELRREHAERVAEAAREAAQVADEVAEILVDEVGESLAEKWREAGESRQDEWLFYGGVVACVVGVALMFIASFAESPVWGIAFFLTSGLSWLPFFFLCFKKAWFPSLVSGAGTAMIVVFFIGRAGG